MKKRIMGLMLVLSMVVTLFTGCTNEEVGYYNLAKEASTIDIMECNATLEINTDELLAYIEEQVGKDNVEQIAVLQKVRTLLKEKQIQFYIKYDENNFECYIQAFIMDKTTKEKEPITTVIYKNEKLYYNVEELIGFLEKYNIVNLDEIFNDNAKNIKYVCIDLNEEEVPSITDMYLETNIQDSAQKYKIYYKLIDEMIKEAMADFTTGKVTKLGNDKYQVAFTGEDVVNTGISFLKHVITNVDKYNEALNTFFDNITAKDLENLFGSYTTYKDIKERQEDTLNYIKEHKQETLNQLDDMKAQLKLGDYKQMINSFKITETLEKVSSTSYAGNVELSFDVPTTFIDRSNESKMIADKANLREITNAVQRYLWNNGTPEIGADERLNITQFLVDEGYLTWLPISPYGNGNYKVELVGTEAKTVITPDNTALYKIEIEDDKSYNISLKLSSNINSLSSANIVEPTEGVVDVKDMGKYAIHQLKVNIDDGSYENYLAKMYDNDYEAKKYAHNANVRALTNAIQRYEWENNDKIDSIQTLIDEGYLKELPVNPFGTEEYKIVKDELGNSKVTPEAISYDDTLDIKVIDDYSYLPARKVVEILGDEINWDVIQKKAYVVVNGQNIYLDGVIINDHTYIKVRELEKLGYKVNWNEATREVEIQK
ncbi:MAG: hypothetical protein A2Y24_08500 [Clostridiales bacterium GWE2_32_10]|nr:MAG: hypothetical protein A2Y24_08500 [Clostridiales bacterium GWE2_32_10]HBY20621.1 hypothetical protein [Clostridiales bacterium]